MMMFNNTKYILLTLFASLSLTPIFGQKRVLSLRDLNSNNWPTVYNSGEISSDGKFASYIVTNQPKGSRTLIFQAIAGHWKAEIIGGTSAAFTLDGKQAIFKKNDSLGVITLGSPVQRYIADVVSHQLFRVGATEYLTYQSKKGKVIIENLNDSSQLSFDNVSGFIRSPNGRYLLLKRKINEDNEKVSWIELPNGAEKVMWEGNVLSSITWSSDGNRVAFIVKGSGNDGAELWIYDKSAFQARKLHGSNEDAINDKLNLDGVVAFSSDAQRLYLRMKEHPLPKVDSNGDAVKVDVWHYSDLKLQSQQLIELSKDGSPLPTSDGILAKLELDDLTFKLLQEKGEHITLISDRWALITNRASDTRYESHWNQVAQPDYYMLDLNSLDRKPVNYPFKNLSPSGKYVLGDDGLGNYYSYEFATGKVRNITADIPVKPGDGGYDEPYRKNHNGIQIGSRWLEGSDRVLLYDRYDIWQVDVSGNQHPLNVTKGYGRKNKLIFRFCDHKLRYNIGELIILDAFNEKTKSNGFYSIRLGGYDAPSELFMGPFVFSGGNHMIFGSEKPVKADNADIFLVKRSSSSESPNYFWTDDFRQFHQLSNIYPESRFNWYRSEPIYFPMLDGRVGQGILYKPANFDPTFDYPVIINFYERRFDKLNAYITPTFSDGDINIPYFVSNGYLVFVPDIYYSIGEIGNSAVNAVVGAGEYLKMLPFIDGNRMGLSGHSFGACQTLQIVTRSNLFAAACADAGVSNYISQYGRYFLGSGGSIQGFTERYQNRMGKSLWEAPDRYILNSPIFEAHNVNTPMLMVNQKLDGIVFFEQGVQFFSAMRRMGKRAWMLQYDDESHGLLQEKNKRDLTIRITQFFDHYLKGTPAPRWMLEGIPAIRKGIDDGLELVKEKDENGNWITPPEGGLLTEEEQARVKALQNREPITITLN